MKLSSFGMRAAAVTTGILVVLGGCRQPDSTEQGQPVAADTVSVELETPAESAYYHEGEDVLLISNFGQGGPAAIDNDGFISRADPETGEILDLRWIEGSLSSPKGMAIAGNILFVADMDGIKRFDLAAGGEAMAPIPIDTSRIAFPNDVCAAPDGTVYVTDTGFGRGSDALYRIDGEQLTPVAEGPDLLKGPNGCWVDDEGVLVVTFNGNEILRVDSSGSVTSVATLPQGGLDGIVEANGQYLVTSWEAGAVFGVDAATGEASIAVADTPSPADLTYDTQRDHVVVPLLSEAGPFQVVIRHAE